MMLLVPAILIVPLATDLVTVQPSRAEPAVNECKTKPDSSAPAGSHWYYRVNRADQRHCWYLGAEGVKVRSQAREGASPTRAARENAPAMPPQYLRKCNPHKAQPRRPPPPGRQQMLLRTRPIFRILLI